MSSSVRRPTEVVTGTREDSASPISESTIALNIAQRREELLQNTPGAVELAAHCLFRFHASINGSLAPALKSRSESYARREGVGIKGFPVEDVCELMTIDGPHKSIARNAVRELLTPIWNLLEGEEPGGLVEMGEAVADHAREAGEVGDAFMRGKTATQILKELGESDAKSRRLRSALRKREQVSEALAQVLRPATH